MKHNFSTTMNQSTFSTTVMEIIIYTALIIVLWVSTLSWLLPVVLLLKCSKTCREVWFSWFCVRVCGPLLNPVITKMKRQAFNRLKDHLGDRKGYKPLEILEIGVGEGTNFQFYPGNSNLTVVDKSRSLLNYFEVNLQKYPQLTLKRAVVGLAADLLTIEDGSFDVVICTDVLCSVERVRSALNEIQRVLKPGGTFLFVEHIPYPESSWLSTLQKYAAPLWEIYFNGCILTKKTDDEIMRTGFTDVVMDKYHPKNMWLIWRSHITGIATK